MIQEASKSNEGEHHQTTILRSACFTCYDDDRASIGGPVEIDPSREQCPRMVLKMLRFRIQVTLVILVTFPWRSHQNEGPGSCSQCTSSLSELLEQIDLDIKYANKTIEKSRTNAKFGLKLEQLEMAYIEHATGLNRSEVMYRQATETVIKLTTKDGTSNSTAYTGAIKILDELETEVEQIESPSELQVIHLKNLHNVQQLSSAVDELRSNLATQLERLNDSRDHLGRIENNYLDHPTCKTNMSAPSSMIELGGGVIKRMVRESKALIRAQENGCDKLGNTLDELTSCLRQTTMSTKYIKTMMDSSELYTGIVSAALNLSQPLRIEDLNDLDIMLLNSISLARNVSENFMKLNHSLGPERWTVGSEILNGTLRLTSHLRLIDLKAARINKNLKTGSDQLPEISRFLNGSETIDLSAKLSGIKTQLARLNDKISTKWLEPRTRTTQGYLGDDGTLRTAIEEFENLTRSVAWQDFFGLNHSTEQLDFNVNSMIEMQATIDQLSDLKNSTQASSTLLNETKRMEGVVFLELIPNVTLTRHFITEVEADLTKSRSEISKLNESITNDAAKFVRPSLADEMLDSTSKANALTSRVHELVDKTNKMIDEFSFKTQNLHKQDENPRVDGIKEVFEYLGESSNKTFEEPQIFALVDWLLGDLNKTLSVQVNRSQAAELTRLSGTEMQQMTVRLRNKVNHARSLINQFCQVPEYGRMVSFPRPKSNISSSFVQSLNLNHELDELTFEHSGQNEEPGSLNLTNGHIKRLTIKFRSLQQNGLLVHHSRPDHSSFMSIYITGGRLMLAINFDKKIRIESHISLCDGKWHTIQLIVSRRMSHHYQQKQQQQLMHQQDGVQSGGGCNRVKHTICAILDDSFTYKSRFSVCFEPISLTPKASAVTDHHDQGKRSVGSSAEEVAADVVALPPVAMSSNLTERLLNHADDDSNWEEQSKKILYFGGVEDKYIPLLRNQQIPTNFHGCIADVAINNIKLNFLHAKKNQAVLVNHCQPD